jgi:hypothetical protein
MRMAAAVALGILVIEILLAAAFLIGLYWLGTWWWGLLLSGALLLLLSLPWLGELKLVFDSGGPRAALRVAWWGRASFHVVDDQTRAIFRILGIPFRRTIGGRAKPAVDEREDEEAPDPEDEGSAPEDREADQQAPASEMRTRRKPFWQLIDVDTIEGFSRAITTALSAGNELIWDARECRVWLTAPTGSAMADTALERVFGLRAVGPIHVILTGEPQQRRVRLRYRIGLLRGALAALQMIANGRAIQFARIMKQKSARQPLPDTDQDLIDDMLEQQKGETQ